MTDPIEQLRDPATLLAEALDRVRRADTLVGDLGTFDAAIYHVGVAQTFARIAKVAGELAAADRTVDHVFGEFDFDTAEAGMLQPGPAREYEPQAVNGVRFTANLFGHYVGTVSGGEWLHVPGHGFIDITHGRRYDGPPGGPGFILSGRVVSATPDHVLCITDGGVSVMLPRALIVESPDE